MWKRKLLTLILVIIVLCSAVLTAAAAPPGSLTLTLLDHGKPVVGDELVLYRVFNARGGLTPDFAGSGAAQAEGPEAAAALLEYALREKISPCRSGKTDAQGKLVFTGLEEGVYLAAQGHKAPQYNSILPFLAPMPLVDGNSKAYDYSAKPKMEPDTRPEIDQITVKKVWKDASGKDLPEADRRESVTVILKKGSKTVSSVELSKKNNWTHTWPLQESSKDWHVEEVPVDGYQASTSTQVSGTTLIVTITNTKGGTTPPKPGGGGGGGGGKPPLIQTGQLNWPIPLLALAGIVLFAAGWALTFLKGKGRK